RGIREYAEERDIEQVRVDHAVRGRREDRVERVEHCGALQRLHVAGREERDRDRVGEREREDELLETVHAAPCFMRASSRLRSSFLCTLPVVVIGSASMNSISRGYSYGARRPLTWVWMSSTSFWSFENPGCRTMKAFTMDPRVASGLPITAAFATAGCLTRQLSISAGPMR